MNVAKALAVGCVIAGLLWLSLDSGTLRPPAERLMSVPLAVLALIFGASAWSASIGGYTQRAPLLAGLSAGVGSYAVVRLLL